MCLLIVLRGRFPRHPVVVGGNRDESTDRKSAPPGLWVGERRRVLSPRDRVAGGTWLGINDRGLFAGITNWRRGPVVPEAPSRGHLPHLALDQNGLDDAVAAVRERAEAAPHSGFQLVLADADRIVVVRNTEAGLAVIPWAAPTVLITNEHGPGELEPRRLAAAVAPQPSAERQLDALAPLLQERGGDGEHAIAKHGERYATVSSSLIAVPADDAAGLLWRYAPGPPDVTSYRNYGNLGRRLAED
ncbi:MAG: NRDE family protein [Planctomycetes bacterium]|nr:NRDE family protein [Planctomycetota bacterium]